VCVTEVELRDRAGHTNRAVKHTPVCVGAFSRFQYCTLRLRRRVCRPVGARLGAWSNPRYRRSRARTCCPCPRSSLKLDTGSMLRSRPRRCTVPRGTSHTPLHQPLLLRSLPRRARKTARYSLRRRCRPPRWCPGWSCSGTDHSQPVLCWRS